jgi:hypothetical protein
MEQDPQKQQDLALENEIRKLKMQAEYGARFGAFEELPPEIEGAFLDQVEAFEKSWANRRTVTVYEHIGQPQIQPAEELAEDEMKGKLERLQELLEIHGIQLSFVGEYPIATRYAFLSGEFMQHQFEMVPVPGMTVCFIYEEFHPDHHRDICEEVEEFFSHWMEKRPDYLDYRLCDPMVAPEGRSFPRKLVLAKIRQVLDAFDGFSLAELKVENVEFTYDREEETGAGRARGHLSYEARMETGEVIRYTGSMHFLLRNKGYGWMIEGFEIPGFTWSALW